MGSMIEVENFVKRYGDFTAVDQVSFEVESGSIFAFLGPNGAGKSTTINTLCTITQKTSGRLTINGYDTSKEQNEVRRAIGVVFQESTLDSKMTVEENLHMHGHFYDVPKSLMNERIDFVLGLLDMKAWRKAMVSSLSGGMKRRIEIARSLLHLPKVLFLDEPTTGLDPQTRRRIWDYLVEIQRERGMTIFLTTHYMEEAEICDKVAIMDHGKIKAFDTPHALKRSYTTNKANLITSDEQELLAQLHERNISYSHHGGRFTIPFREWSELAELIHQIEIQELEVSKGTLNEVFLEVTGKDIRG